jgi:hypothetical protein
LISDEDRTNAVIVSTLMEAWGVVQAGLVADKTVKDVGRYFLSLSAEWPSAEVAP